MISYLFFIGICVLTGAIGSFATMPEIQGWYQGIQKPLWTPPSGIFGPVWTLLYILMGIAAARVWKKRSVRPVTAAMIVFAVQLILNGAWSFIFFGAHRPDFAFAEIILLWLMIILMVKVFWSIDKPAAGLMAPYLLWVSFASCLNFAIWQMNR